MPERSSAPIGVFDSGVGGLSVLRALQAELPDERFIYVADSGHAPYGDRDDTHVLARSHRIAEFLTAQHQIKLLVVACNTATAAAIRTLRERHPQLPLVGIEPAIKPAASHSQTRLIAVLATRATLNSEKFQVLQSQISRDARIILQPCDGLAHAIERNDHAAIESLCATYMGQLGPFGTDAESIDSVVLGCTHYPFVLPTLALISGPQVQYFDAGTPVARHTRTLLERFGLQAPTTAHTAHTANTPIPAQTTAVYYTSGAPVELNAAVQRWLGQNADASPLAA